MKRCFIIRKIKRYVKRDFRRYGSATDVTSCNEQRYTDEEAITYYGGLGIQEQPARPPV